MQDVSHLVPKEMAVSLKWEFAKIKHFLRSASSRMCSELHY